MRPNTSGEKSDDSRLLFDAHALVRRGHVEAERMQILLAGFLEFPTHPAPPGVSQLIAATQAYQLVDLIQGYPARTRQEYRDEAIRSLSDGFLNDLLASDAEDSEIYGTNPQGFRDFLRDFGEAIDGYASTSIADQSSNPKESPLALYHSAVEFRDELNNGTTVEDIFSRDELYEDLYRRTYNPLTIAEDFINSVEAITFESTLKAGIQSVIAQLRFTEQSYGDEISDEEAEEIERDARDDPEFMEKMAELHEDMRQGYALVTKTVLERFWGKDIISQLPKELSDRLQMLAKNDLSGSI